MLFFVCALVSRLIRSHLGHLQDSISYDCYVRISQTLRIRFHWIVASASYVIYDSLSSDCCVSISCTLGFSVVGLLCQYLMYFSNNLSLNVFFFLRYTFVALFRQHLASFRIQLLGIVPLLSRNVKVSSYFDCYVSVLNIFFH